MKMIEITTSKPGKSQDDMRTLTIIRADVQGGNHIRTMFIIRLQRAIIHLTRRGRIIIEMILTKSLYLKDMKRIKGKGKGSILDQTSEAMKLRIKAVKNTEKLEAARRGKKDTMEKTQARNLVKTEDQENRDEKMTTPSRRRKWNMKKRGETRDKRMMRFKDTSDFSFMDSLNFDKFGF